MSPTHPWPTPPSQLNLASEEIHIWCLHLDVKFAEMKELTRVLSDDEQTRADRFHFDIHRQRFVARRGQMRHILSRYVEKAAESLRFDYGPHGKPFFPKGTVETDVRFNCSTSYGMALLAITYGRDVGIDLELIRPLRDAEAIANRYFSREEFEILQTISAENRDLAFLHVWTCKEAVLKATGTGLSFPLDQLAVSADPTQPARVLSIDGMTPSSAASWQLASFRPGDGFVGAIASLGSPHHTEYWTCPD